MKATNAEGMEQYCIPTPTASSKPSAPRSQKIEVSGARCYRKPPHFLAYPFVSSCQVELRLQV